MTHREALGLVEVEHFFTIKMSKSIFRLAQTEYPQQFEKDK